MTLDRVCRRASARERILLALAELGDAELEQLAQEALRLVAARAATADPRCPWTGLGQRGRIRCTLVRGHAGEHVWRAGEAPLCTGWTSGIGGRRRCDLPAGHDGSCQWGRP